MSRMYESTVSVAEKNPLSEIVKPNHKRFIHDLRHVTQANFL